MLTPNEEKIVAQLQRGDKKKIADNLGLHKNTVLAVLKGRFNNDDVWREVVAIIKERNQLKADKMSLANA